MSYKNGTTHYNLPQTVGTDKRDWFDTNEAFASVDSALHTASETASTAASDIVTLGGRVTDLETASGSQAQDIVDIKADILSQGGAITRLDGEIDGVKADALDMICAVDEGTAQVATVAVSEGQYFRYNDVLYIATANIGVGDTIVPNTNCTATNVATELQGLSVPNASDVSYDNTSSGLVGNNVQNAIDELDSTLDSVATQVTRMEKYTPGNSINLNNYSSASNQYTTTDDGYLTVLTGSNAGDTVTAHVLSGDNRIQIKASGANDVASLYVRKGMKVYYTDQAGQYIVVFTPIQ